MKSTLPFWLHLSKVLPLKADESVTVEELWRTCSARSSTWLLRTDSAELTGHRKACELVFVDFSRQIPPCRRGRNTGDQKHRAGVPLQEERKPCLDAFFQIRISLFKLQITERAERSLHKVFTEAIPSPLSRSSPFILLFVTAWGQIQLHSESMT